MIIFILIFHMTRKTARRPKATSSMCTPLPFRCRFNTKFMPKMNMTSTILILTSNIHKALNRIRYNIESRRPRPSQKWEPTAEQWTSSCQSRRRSGSRGRSASGGKGRKRGAARDGEPRRPLRRPHRNGHREEPRGFQLEEGDRTRRAAQSQVARQR